MLWLLTCVRVQIALAERVLILRGNQSICVPFNERPPEINSLIQA